MATFTPDEIAFMKTSGGKLSREQVFSRQRGTTQESLGTGSFAPKQFSSLYDVPGPKQLSSPFDVPAPLSQGSQDSFGPSSPSFRSSRELQGNQPFYRSPLASIFGFDPLSRIFGFDPLAAVVNPLANMFGLGPPGPSGPSRLSQNGGSQQGFRVMRQRSPFEELFGNQPSPFQDEQPFRVERQRSPFLDLME